MVNDIGLKIGNSVFSLFALASELDCNNIPFVLCTSFLLSELLSITPEEALDILYKDDIMRDIRYEELVSQLKQIDYESIRRKIREDAKKVLRKILLTPKDFEDALSRVIFFLTKDEIDDLEKNGLVFNIYFFDT